MNAKYFTLLVLLLPFVVLAQDSEMVVSKSYVIFDAVAPTESSLASSLLLTNKGSSDKTIGTISLQGAHSDEFNITSDGCSSQTLSQNNSCSVNVEFTPNSNGSKNALLHIPYDSKALNVFLTNREDNVHNAKRRITPVMYDLNISEELNASTAYSFSWSVVGYHNNYKTKLVLFDCTGLAEGACGSSYNNSERFLDSGSLSATTELSEWSYKGQNATKFNYTYDYTIPATRANADDWNSSGSSIVARFYVVSDEDEANGESTLTLIIPGNLTQHYYDNEGRRVEKKICPNGGCN